MVETLSVTDMLPRNFEPNQSHRYILAIEGIDSYLIKTTSRPSIATEEIAIPWLNATRYIAGKTTFGDMSVTLHDAIAPSGAQQVMEWIRLHYESVSGRGGYADFYKRDIQLKIVDAVGNVVQLWDIKGAFITAADFSDLSYEGGDTMEISLTIRFDNVLLVF